MTSTATNNTAICPQAMVVSTQQEVSQSSVPTLPGVMVNDVKVVNLTPHPIYLTINGEIVEIPISGQLARIIYDRKMVNTLLGISGYELRKAVFVGLPEQSDGIVYIVSGEIRAKLSERFEYLPDIYTSRPDVISPFGVTKIKLRGKEEKCATTVAL